MQISHTLLLLAVLGAFAGVPAAASPAVSTGGQWSVDSLSTPRKALASTSDGQRIYFVGGRVDAIRSDVVDIYDTSTHTWATAKLTEARSELAATAVGGYVLVAGGSTSSTTSTATVDVLDTATMTWSVASLSQARLTLSATTVGTRAMFAGGITGGPMAPGAVSDVVDVYDSAVGPPSDPLAWSVIQLSVARGQMGAITVGTQALFAGGVNATSAADTVDVYDSAVGPPSDALAWSTTQLSVARSQMAAATAGTRAFFGGGVTTGAPTFLMSDRVDVYDSAVGPPTDPLAWSWTTLSIARASLSAAAFGDCVYFAGGITSDPVLGPGNTDVVDVLQASTSTWSPVQHLSLARHNLEGAAAGHHILFGGGNSTGQIDSTVDALEFPSPTPPAEVTRLGTPPNPDVLKPGLTSGPVIGATWDPFIDHATFFPGAILDVLTVALAPGPVNLPTPMGTLLCDLSIPPLFFVASPGVPFVASIPANPSFVGLQLVTQGASADGVTVALTNALDITIGTH